MHSIVDDIALYFLVNLIARSVGRAIQRAIEKIQSGD
jgi:hypothetical protein